MISNLLMQDQTNLIILESDYLPMVFSFRNKHPEIPLKFMMINEAIDILTFSYVKDPIPYLIKEKRIEYNKAKKYLLLLKNRNVHLNPELNSLLNDLIEQGYIETDVNKKPKKDNLGLMELSNSNLLVLERDEDKQLIGLLNENNLKFSHLHFSDLDYLDKPLYNELKVYDFTTKFDQFFYIFSSLKKDLLNIKEDDILMRNQFLILCKDLNDMFYVNLFAKIFNIETYINKKYPLSYDLDVKNKLNTIQKEKSIKFSNDDNNKFSLKVLQNLIKSYDLEEVFAIDFDFAFNNLVEICGAKSIVENPSTKGILVASTYNFYPDHKIYVSNFEYNCFYKEFSDDNVISDLEIENIGGNPSYVLTTLDKIKKENYYRYLNVQLLSRCEQHLTDKIFNSQFADKRNKELKKIDENATCILEGKITDSILLSEEAKKMLICDIYDKAFYSGVNGEINAYDSSFKGTLDPKDVVQRDEFSVTKLKEYVKCPFKYLMDDLIPSFDEEKHQLWKGTLIHKVLEYVYDKDFDYELAFEKGLEEYKKSVAKAKKDFDLKEKLIVEVIKYWLKPITLQIHDELNHIHFTNWESDLPTHEIRTHYTINGTNFVGSIDKIYLTEWNNTKYYTIADYKTGSHSSDVFDPLYSLAGYDIQLVLYYYSSTNDEELVRLLKDFTFGGAGIKHVYGNTLPDGLVEDKKISSKILMKKEMTIGLSLYDNDYFHSFSDNNIKKEDGSIVAHPEYISNKTIFNNGRTIDDGIQIEFNKGFYVNFPFEDFVKCVIEKVAENLKDIQQCKFPIRPLYLDKNKEEPDKLPCVFCPYRDICYRKLKDAVSVNDIVKNDYAIQYEDNEEEIKEDSFDA